MRVPTNCLCDSREDAEHVIEEFHEWHPKSKKRFWIEPLFLIKEVKNDTA